MLRSLIQVLKAFTAFLDLMWISTLLFNDPPLEKLPPETEISVSSVAFFYVAVFVALVFFDLMR